MSNSIISVGFDNLVNWERVLTVLNPVAAGAKKRVAAAREDGSLLDVSMGRKVRSVLVFDNGAVLLSALNPKTIRERGDGKQDTSDEEDAN